MRYLRWLFHVLGSSLGLLIAALLLAMGSVLGFALWAQSGDSLPRVLALASRWMPAGQSLQVQGVTGSLHAGGRVQHLLWQGAGLRVEAEDVTVAWDWQALLHRQLRLTTLQMQALHIEDSRPASGKPLADSLLPLQLDLPFAVAQLQWAGPPAVELRDVQGHYRYDGSHHTLTDTRLRLADANYRVDAQLQARAPGALRVQASGTVAAPVGSLGKAGTVVARTLQLDASGSVQGTLYGANAALDVLLDLQPSAPSPSPPQRAGSTPKTTMQAPMQAHIQARVLPYAAQPIAHADAQWSQFNLASVWPQALQTSLSGSARVTPTVHPDGTGWQADLQLHNALEGPLDQQQLPVKDLTARVLYRDGANAANGGQGGNGAWQLAQLQASAAGGTVQAKGSYAAAAGAAWSVEGSAKGLLAERVDSRWKLPVLNAEGSVRQTPAGIVFETSISGAAPGQASDSIALQTQGLWQAPLLQLQTLDLQAPQAHIRGKLEVNTQTYASSGELQASLPGAEGHIAGQASASAGQGNSRWQVRDAKALLAWLAQWPVLGEYAKILPVQGDAEFSANWQGGWQNHAAALQLDAQVRARHLIWQEHYALDDVRLDAHGSLQKLVLQLAGKAQAGATRVALQTEALLQQNPAGPWHARFFPLQASVADGLQPIPWKLTLEQPLDVDWQQSALARSLKVAAGTLRLTGPAPGEASVQWEAAQWAQGAQSGRAHSGGVAHAGGASPAQPPAQPSAQWHTRGSVQGVPLAWLEVLGQTQLVNLGLRGNLVFGGQWDASGGAALQVLLRAERSSGDLQLLGGDAASPVLEAGLRDASVELRIERDAVQASALWDSQAGGKVQADFSTRLSADGSGNWPMNAPVQGRLTANLPKVGAWSMFAPVGWRIHGTLDAEASLTGTRAKPVWQGTLEARDLALRSVVDGIDLRNGQMRLQLDGQHMELLAFSVQGAAGADGTGGGLVSATGSVDWLDVKASGTTPLQVAKRLRIYIDAEAQGFRARAQPDQRVVVSGNLSARLVDAKLYLRGVLVADQALIVLPEDNIPKLGSDVVVYRQSDAAKVASVVANKGPVSSLLASVAPDLQVMLDPGNNFQLQGNGISTRLAGQLTLSTQGNSFVPVLNGELHTVNGSYKAYGQNLDIEKGNLRFSGAYDNPALDIRAVRPNLQQVVGVQISGTAQLPVLRLFAEPELPEIEKLSWLVLGHAGANGGAQAALLQQAALSLLGGKSGSSPVDPLFNALGLDEVSLGQTAVTNLDGSTGSQTSVKFGKRLSRDFYVAYERSLAGTLGTLYIFYDLSRRFTLRAESGSTNAVDLLFTTRYD